MSNIKKSLEKLNQSGLRLPAIIWRKIHTFLFFIVLLAALAFGGLVWYENIYNQEWSEEKKTQFMQERDKSIVFKEAAFKKVIEENIARKNRFDEPFKEVRNIFAPY